MVRLSILSDNEGGRMKKVFSFIIIIICLISGCSCDNVTKTTIFSSHIKAYSSKNSNSYSLVSPFGTYISLVGYNEKKVKSVEDEFNNLVERYHALLDRNYYYKDSEGNFINNIKVINDSYGSNNSVDVDEIIIEILKEGIKYTKLSNGKFNIFSGSIVDLWEKRFDITSSLYKVDPSGDEVREALKCVVKVSDIDSVFVIDDENNKVKFNKVSGCKEASSITLGALAKSFFLDKLAKQETFVNIGSAIYDAGQSSIIVKGENPTRESKEWFIAIKDSLSGGNAVQLKVANDNAISTSSGDYKGYIKEDGTRRHHIIDATSGYPSGYLLAATVVGESAMIMDVVSTSLMCMNLEEIKNYLILLEDAGVKIKVLLQVKDENNKLRLLLNKDMNSIVKEVYSDASTEVFVYGA